MDLYWVAKLHVRDLHGLSAVERFAYTYMREHTGMAPPDPYSRVEYRRLI
jgi:hypothetical protein